MNITEETIDSFLHGDLTGSELTAFNQAVASDPKLQQEISIQQEIVDSVKDYRHQQLKNRLNSIDVKPIGLPFYASPYMKLAASIGVVAILIGGYSLFSTNKEEQTSTNSEIASAIESNSTASEISSLIESTDNTQEEQIISTNSKNNSVNQTTSEQTRTSSLATATQKTVATVKSNNKTSTTSTYDDLSEETMDSDNTIEGINDNFQMPTMNNGGNSSTISSPQIKVSIVKENNLGYRFFNNQLFLHGNFSNSTYELFELNNKPTKQLFLYFESSYYELIQGKTKLTSLTPITDKSVLLQLTQLREH